MREIKFRQWLGGKFHYWGLNVGPCDFVSPASANKLNAGNTVHQQFTGLHDKNGKEIYEGDILQMHWKKGGGVAGSPFVIEWDEQRARYTDFSPKDAVEVIGNIYEHGYLLRFSY